jgi:predicted dehydrogenase
LYSDYRAVLERTDVDAVVIGSPDHWHVPMVTDAVRAGKDAYVEKPVSHTTEEGDRLDKLMAQSDRIVQVGYQQRSWPHFIEARELVTSGKLGRISMVLTSWYQNYLAMKEANIDVAKLDWKRFLGSAPDQPFDVNRFTRWRWYWDFGGGHLTDLFSHWGDVVHWYMDSDSPATASATGERYVLPQFECPDTITAAWRYPGFQLSYVGTLSGSLDGGNLLFRGTEAMMKLNRDGYAVYPEGRIRPERTNYPEAAVSGESKGDGTVAHMHNFLDCVRSRKEPNSPVRTAVKIARVAHLANTAMRNGVVWKA